MRVCVTSSHVLDGVEERSTKSHEISRTATKDHVKINELNLGQDLELL